MHPCPPSRTPVSRLGAALLVVCSLSLAACAGEPKKTVSAAPAPAVAAGETVEQRNAKLLAQHTEVWGLMGLSQKAADELNGIVVAVNSQVDKNKHAHPEKFAGAKTVKRADHPLTRDEYLANHKKRFDFLKISEPTQKELFGAADFVWGALHSPDADKKYSAEQRKTAGIVRDMMGKMGGPPPCCDDNIFERASAN